MPWYGLIKNFKNLPVKQVELLRTELVWHFQNSNFKVIVLEVLTDLLLLSRTQQMCSNGKEYS